MDSIGRMPYTHKSAQLIYVCGLLYTSARCIKEGLTDMENFEAKKEIIAEGSDNNIFYIIAGGSVTASVSGHEIILKKGDIVGIFDITSTTHTYSYNAAEDCALIPYPFNGTESLLALLNNNSDLRKLFILSFCRNIVFLIREAQTSYKESMDLYNYIQQATEEYHNICQEIGLHGKTLPYMEELQPLESEDTPPFFLDDYYAFMRKIISETTGTVPSQFVYGFLVKSQEDVGKMLTLSQKLLESQKSYAHVLLNEDFLDVFDLYCDLFFRARSNGAKADNIDAAIRTMTERLQKLPQIDKMFLVKRVSRFQTKAASVREKKQLSKEEETIHNELNSSINVILDYGHIDLETASEFQKYLEEFKQLSDKNATDRSVDTVRKYLTRYYYDVYREVLKAALNSVEIPTIIKMFLNFGYVDPNLCGFDNAITLYEFADTFHGLRDQGIYTSLEWFQEIYCGNKQPSRNEFEQDYIAYVRTLKREKKIDNQQEADMLKDNEAKVMYELDNMFPQANKVTFGRVLTFCPVLIEENLLKPFDELTMTPQKILGIFDKIGTIDYSAFYHEILFEDAKINIKETVRVDVRPDVILAPNAGMKGILWQECEGMHRTTPGRMVISALHMENAEKTFIRMTGEFRWEMCKRTMGARWNDFATHSLTSDYCSYAQFFSKNRDLSYDAKEKLKETLKRCKNSYKEMFVQDYLTFIQYESTGSSRLNKVSRGILFLYCPFRDEICQKLQGNGAFQEFLDKHRIHKGQALHRINQILQKYQNSGNVAPDEIASQKELVDR